MDYSGCCIETRLWGGRWGAKGDTDARATTVVPDRHIRCLSPGSGRVGVRRWAYPEGFPDGLGTYEGKGRDKSRVTPTCHCIC